VLENDFECWLLNARHLRNVPGRKTDVADAVWIGQLVEHGLVRPSLRSVARGEHCSLDSNAHGLKEGQTMALQLTLLDLVKAVSDSAASEAEVVATVVHLVNSGIVQLCGNFRGARFDLDPVDLTAAA
jgi:hypothetical protein